MRVVTLVLFELALLLANAHSVRVGEEERRIWAPVVAALAGSVLILRLPALLRIDKAVLTSAPVLLYAAYLVWLGITQFWSVDPGEGRHHILVLWVVFLAALSLADEHPARTVAVYVVAVVLAALIGWAGVAAQQGWAVGRTEVWRFKGIMMHEQVMLLVVAAAVVLALVGWVNRRRCGLRLPVPPWVCLGAAGLLLVSMAATKGRSLTAFFVVTLLALGGWALRGGARWLVVGGGLAASAVAWLVAEEIAGAVERGHEDTLSGRTTVWARTWHEIVRRPLGGWGYGTYQDHFFDLWTDWVPGHAHNLWLQVWFESGLAGVVIVTALLLAILWRGWLLQRAAGVLSYGFFLTIFTLLGSTMSVFFAEKIGTLYGLLLLLVIQEERLLQGVRRLRSRPSRGGPLEMPRRALPTLGPPVGARAGAVSGP